MSFQNYNQNSEKKEYDLTSVYEKKEVENDANFQYNQSPRRTNTYMEIMKKSKIFHLCTLVSDVPESRALISESDFTYINNYLANLQHLRISSGLGIISFLLYLQYKEKQNLMLRLTFRPSLIGSIFRYMVFPMMGTVYIMRIYERIKRRELEEIASKYDLQNEDFMKITMNFLQSRGFVEKNQSSKKDS